MIIRANGVELSAETFGDPANPAILLIHGAGNTMLSWDEALCQRLAAGPRFVIRYDLRDAGRSASYEPGAPPYGLRDLVADAAGLLDALGVPSAHVVGLSTGGAIGQLLGLDHPDRVATLTLIAATPGIPGEETAGLPGPSSELRSPPEPDWSDRAAVIEYLVESERPFSPRFDEAAARELAARVFDHTTDPASTSNVYLLDPGEPWRARLAEITAPTLVIHGTEDPFFPFDHARALAREIPNAELLAVAHMGHEYLPPATWDVVVPAILAHTRRAAGCGFSASNPG
jgi:pimeloyl-ACP methyl ester carboxylesterase